MRSKATKYILNAGLFLGLLLFGLALYSIPLHSNSFCFDDHTAIVDDMAIKTIDFPKIFEAFNTRFLVGLSFALNYHWFGLNPQAYHLTNFFIHGLNAFLVFLLINATLSLYPWRRGIHPQWPVWFGTILFFCHPLQTEPVNFITQRLVLMGTFFYLLTLLLYIQYRRRGQKRYLLAALLAAAADMFCKEFVVSLPLMIALYEFCFLNQIKQTVWQRCRHLIPFFIVVLIVPLLLLRTPSQALGVAAIADIHFAHDGTTQASVVDITRARGGVNRLEYFMTEWRVLCTYIRLLFLPFNQNFDYDYPLSNTLDAKTALSGLVLLGLLIIAWKTWEHRRIISFGILWFFIALSVESSFIPIGHVIAEYRVYLASVGFVFVAIDLLYGRGPDVRINVIAAIVLIGFSILTYQRNEAWKDEFTLWTDTIKKSPYKPRPYNDRCYAYFLKGKYTQALSDCNKAIELNGDYADAYNNRGNVYAVENKFIQALPDFNKAIRLNPGCFDAYNNRGNIYAEEKKFSQALSDFTAAITIKSDFANAYFSRGNVYAEQGDFFRAIHDYGKAIELSFQDAEAYNNRGMAYSKKGDFDAAIADFNKAIELKSDYAQAYNNRGSVYGDQKDYDQAMADFDKAIALNPKDAEAYNNRGKIYSIEGDYDQAILNDDKAILLKNDYPEAYNVRAEAYDNLGIFYGKKGNMPQAIQDFTKAIDSNSSVAIYYVNRAVANYSEGNFGQVIKDCSKAIALQPNYLEAYLNRGNAYDSKSNYDGAVSDYSKAIAINPNDAQVYNNRAITFFKQKEYDKSWNDEHKAEKSGFNVDPRFLAALKQASGRDN